MKAAKISFFVILTVSILVFFVMKMLESGSSEPELPVIGKVSVFQLTDQEDEVFSSRELEDKVWVTNFVFTRCAGPCPLITSRMAEIQKELAEFKNIHYVTITMDAQFDTPEILKEFGSKHEADFSSWHFLTGDSTNILDIARNIFKVPADKDPEMHTTRFVLVDKESNIRGYYDSLDDDSFERLKRALKKLSV